MINAEAYFQRRLEGTINVLQKHSRKNGKTCYHFNLQSCESACESARFNSLWGRSFTIFMHN